MKNVNSPSAEVELGVDLEDYVPPLGLTYVYSSAKSNGHNVSILDAAGQDLPLEKVTDYICTSQPDVIACNAFSTNKELVKIIMQQFGDRIRFIVGGAGMAGLASEFMQIDGVNSLDIVCGDGEHIIRDLLDPGESKTSQVSLHVVDKYSNYYVKSIDDLSLDRFDLMNNGFSTHHGRIEACMIATRGCVYNCAFCGSAKSRNRELGVRRRSLDSLKREMANMIAIQPKLESIRFIDDLFLLDEKSLRLAIALFEQGKNLQWRAMAHVKSFRGIKTSVIRQLEQSGCRELFMGIESGSPRILRKIHKTNNLEEIQSTVKNILMSGISVKAYFIYGFPSEKEDDCKQTFEFAKRLKSLETNANGKIRFSVFKFRPYHGTELADQLVQIGRGIDSITDTSLNRSLEEKRKQFNFEAGNFSECKTEVLDDYIKRTLSLNDTAN